ncbi:conserved exported protein of unknown function [Methylacidimicrobium sp. AP8]|uniref:hypothetical protein n=1 Tax=Methylacidimicrobium sp. AP8 TaxID=2730359 RepID=UPI0018C1C710|nr:hypothetical protein [Methylacidimicrobium sp. AP8]CAB4243591.1 conserved exported protein of unknown function [Methylacidimicrobium sp. AP8]
MKKRPLALFCLAAAALVPAGCGTGSPVAFAPACPVDVPCRASDPMLSSQPVRVRPSRYGFVLSESLRLGGKRILPAGTELRAERVYVQSLPPRYVVDGLRLDPRMPFVPATGDVIEDGGVFWATLSNARIPRERPSPKR